MLIKNILVSFTLLSASLVIVGCSQSLAKNDTGNTLANKIIKNDDYVNAEQLYPQVDASIAPELSVKGDYPVGVKTLTIVNPRQLDPVSQTLKDRELKIEVWYPSDKSFVQNTPKTVYKNQTKLGLPFSLKANAYRDVEVHSTEAAKYPLIVLSHGYTGYRTLMFYLGEHLASHGYIVASIDHTDSTTAEIDVKKAPYGGFVSTLLNRSRDQQFTSNYFTTSDNFLSKVINTENVGLIGYSMGGYGAVNTIGGCYNFNETTASMFTGIKDPEQIKKIIPVLNSCAGGQYANAVVSNKWKAAMAFAPWGSQHGLFNPESVKSIETPIMYLSGDLDDISDYKSIKGLYNQTGSKNKYLLTYENARHNIAPHPAPSATYANSIDMGHYIEGSWSTINLNNINKHFALALMDCHVKQKADKCEYLNLSESSNQKPVNDKVPASWKGFEDRFATGMQWLSN